MAPPRRKDGPVVVSVLDPFLARLTDDSSLASGLHMPIHSLHIVLPSTLHRLCEKLMLGAFIGSLVTGMVLHYKKIVKNEYYGYPQEWFPSVSATIGDSPFPGEAYYRRLVSGTECVSTINCDLFGSSIRVNISVVSTYLPTRNSTP